MSDFFRSDGLDREQPTDWDRPLSVGGGKGAVQIYCSECGKRLGRASYGAQFVLYTERVSRRRDQSGKYTHTDTLDHLEFDCPCGVNIRVNRQNLLRKLAEFALPERLQRVYISPDGRISAVRSPSKHVVSSSKHVVSSKRKRPSKKVNGL